MPPDWVSVCGHPNSGRQFQEALKRRGFLLVVHEGCAAFCYNGQVLSTNTHKCQLRGSQLSRVRFSMAERRALRELGVELGEIDQLLLPSLNSFVVDYTVEDAQFQALFASAQGAELVSMIEAVSCRYKHGMLRSLQVHLYGLGDALESKTHWRIAPGTAEERAAHKEASVSFTINTVPSCVTQEWDGAKSCWVPYVHNDVFNSHTGLLHRHRLTQIEAAVRRRFGRRWPAAWLTTMELYPRANRHVAPLSGRHFAINAARLVDLVMALHTLRIPERVLRLLFQFANVDSKYMFGIDVDNIINNARRSIRRIQNSR